MSPLRNKPARSNRRFPRVSGDEPTMLPTYTHLPTFSPRERG